MLIMILILNLLNLGEKRFRWNKVSLASIGQGVTIDEEFRGKGYGKAFYYQIAVELGKQGKTLVSASNLSRTEDANRVWKSLVKDGYAKKLTIIMNL